MYYIIINENNEALYAQKTEPTNGERFTDIPLTENFIKAKLQDGIWVESGLDTQ